MYDLSRLNIGLLCVMIMIIVYIAARLDTTNHIVHDAWEGAVRGALSGAIVGGDVTSAFIGGVVFGTISAFTRAVKMTSH